MSSNGLRHFYTLKGQVEVQEQELLKLESDVISLQKFKEELENGDYLLDNALKLGYINEGDKVYFYDYSQNSGSSSVLSYQENQSKAIVVTKKNRSNAFFLLVSVLVGLVLTLTFSVISKKR
jgi:hypothetical protein